MEVTFDVKTESCIYYAVCKDDKYLDNDCEFTYSMSNLWIFTSISTAKNIADKDNAEVRKIKILDLGEV